MAQTHQISLTKIRLPQRRKDIIRRVRLIDALHQNIHRKLSFVSAPAGYGKTTLLVDFASDLEAEVFWYSISRDDQDLIAFARHLLAGFQQIVPDFGESLASLMDASGGRLDAQMLAVEFINHIESSLDDFSVLILDDYHLVDDHEPIVEFIESLLENLPDQLRLLIGSRSVYGIPTANLYVREDLFTIGADALRFRASELQSLIQQNYHVKLADEEAAELAERSDGWIVAILLAVRTMEHGALPSFEGATDQVYSFLAQEVVSHLPEELQEFLVSVSILDEFAEPVCNYLLEVKSSWEFLQELEARNLFVSRIETGEATNFRFHQLFLEFLRQRLTQSDPQRMRDLHSRAAKWYKDLGMWERAIHHKLSAGEKESGAHWMDKAANSFFISGRQHVLAEWYRILTEDPDMRSNSPRFMVNWAKMLVNQSRYEQAVELLDIAERSISPETELDLAVNALIVRGFIQFFQGDYRAAVGFAEQVQEKLKGRGSSRRVRYRRYQASRLKGISLGLLSEAEEAMKNLTIAVDGFRKLGEHLQGAERTQKLHDLAESLNDLGFVAVQHGRLPVAQSAFQEALDIRQQSKSNRGALALARNNVAYIYYLAGQYAKAWRAYNQALEEARTARWGRVMVDIHSGMGDLLLEIDDFKAASEEYQAAIHLAEDMSEHLDGLTPVYVGLAQLNRRQSRFNDAIHWVREAASNMGESIESPQYQAVLGEIYLEMGQLDLAVESLRSALPPGGVLEDLRHETAQAAFVLAEAFFKKGENDEAKNLLSQAMLAVAKLGYDSFLITPGRRAEEFLAFAAQEWPSEQINSMLQRVRTFKPGRGQLSLKESPAPSLTIHLDVSALGPGEVRRNGEMIPGAVWRSNRTRAMFFYLVDRRAVRKEDLALEFWPEFSPAKVSSNFHATLWRVRRAIGGRELVVFEDDYYRIDPSVTLWYDVAEFQDKLQRAAAEEISERQRAEFLRQTVDLYKGDFLESIFMDWAGMRRRELQDQFLSALLDLTRLSIDAGQFPQSQEYCQRGLAIDPHHDQFHLLIIEALIKSGSPTAARAHLKVYSKEVKEDLDIELSPDLLARIETLFDEI
ncbi:MAG: tetratricopeptide repeat protein [Anaerolineae bacterium]|nr:tetratricopeptide repeat protein [Anaerolineae bacterium]